MAGSGGSSTKTSRAGARDLAGFERVGERCFVDDSPRAR